MPDSGIKFINGLGMKTRVRAQWIIAVLFGVWACSLPAFADEVHTYGADFDLLIPATDDPQSK